MASQIILYDDKKINNYVAVDCKVTIFFREITFLLLEQFLKEKPDYSAVIITRDQQDTIEAEEGRIIKVIPVWKWLCDD